MDKRIFLNVVVGLCAVLSLTSCPSDDGGGDDETAVELQVSQTTVTLNEQNTGQVTVTSNTAWSVYCAESWLTVTPSESTGTQTLNLVAKSANQGNTARTATLTISDKKGQKRVSVTVTQNPPPVNYFLITGKEALNFQPAGGEDSFTIKSNDEWTVTCQDAWCTVSPVTGSETQVVSVTVQKNSSLDKRTTTILVTGKNSEIQQQVNVTQDGETAYLNVDNTELTLDDNGGTKSFSITTNDEWSITGSTSWCSLSSTSGNKGTTSVTVTVSQNTESNDRSTLLTIKGVKSNIQKTVTVMQHGVSDPSDLGRNDYDDDIELGGYSLSISPLSLSFSAQGESKTLTITGNDTWAASSSQTWCKLSTTSGTGNGSISVTATQNTTSSERTANIKITPSHGTTINISVTQAKPAEEDSSVGRNDYDNDIDLNKK